MTRPDPYERFFLKLLDALEEFLADPAHDQKIPADELDEPNAWSKDGALDETLGRILDFYAKGQNR
jgi:hypothetical protein